MRAVSWNETLQARTKLLAHYNNARLIRTLIINQKTHHAKFNNDYRRGQLNVTLFFMSCTFCANGCMRWFQISYLLHGIIKDDRTKSEGLVKIGPEMLLSGLQSNTVSAPFVWLIFLLEMSAGSNIAPLVPVQQCCSRRGGEVLLNSLKDASHLRWLYSLKRDCEWLGPVHKCANRTATCMKFR
jgi:hypothetical protein